MVLFLIIYIYYRRITPTCGKLRLRYYVVAQQSGEFRPQFVGCLVFFHKLHESLVVGRSLRNLRLELSQTLLEIVHSEVVELMFGLLT